MNVIRLASGKIFFDEFNDAILNTEWQVIPNDSSRYSLVESPGFIKMFHGIPDIMLLHDEPSSYVLDVKNDYVPNSDLIYAGIIVYKTTDQNLEILEYYDVNKQSAFIYNYLRVIKNNNIYVVYGKNLVDTPWEFIGSVKFDSSAKIGLYVKGPQSGSSPDFIVDYFRLYKSQKVQVLNVAQGYKVDLIYEGGVLASSTIVDTPLNGASFIIDDLMPIRAYFKIYDELLNIVTQSPVYEICGGDIFFHGLTLDVTVNGTSLKLDTEQFLGYYTQSEISFTAVVHNQYDFSFASVTITASQYLDDLSYLRVTFASTIDGEYSTVLNMGDIGISESKTVYGKITRDVDAIPLDIEPFKFNIKLGSL